MGENMKVQLLTLWLLIPFGAGAYHLAAGERRIELDTAGDLLAEGQRLARAEDYALAKEQLEQALQRLGDADPALTRRVQLELAKCQMNASELPQANASLASLVNELAGDPSAPAELKAAARSAYASSEYYMTWLVRLEGAPREEWEPRIETARQTYKLLAEEAQAQGEDAAAERHRQDLEAAIRLARMELSELQGLPLPNQ
jgi:hypothetical protein